MKPGPEISAADYARVRAAFHEALGLDAASRSLLLTRSFPDRPDLRSEVDSLLDVHDGDPDFLEGSGLSADRRRKLHVRVVDSTVFEIPSPPHIPGFRILRLLGEGGFARVWLAEQTEPVRRQVAIKVLRSGWDSRRVMQRFHVERQTLARMSHPDIASILEAGTLGDGLPYFVMDAFEGAPLTEFVRDRDLDIPRRIELLVRICDAIQHAHGRGVLHRDLKPSNLLVAEEDGALRIRVIDFGIAKILDEGHASSTREGTLVGTIAYASPEQLSLDPGAIDVRTDVYALGVLLYEILCGEPPHRLDGLTAAAAARCVLERDPAPLGRRDRKLKGDLEAVTARALARRSSDRYPTVSELATDLRRFLSDLPVIARRPSLSHSLFLFARRHRAATLTAVFVGIAGLSALIWMIQNRERQRRLLETTEASLGLALDIVTEDLYRQTGTLDERRDRLEKALALIVPHVEEDPKNPRLLAEYARILDALGSLHAEEGRFEDAMPYVRRCLTLRERLAELRPDSLQDGRSLAVAIIKRGDLENRHPTRREALSRFDRAHELLEELRERVPEHVGLRDDLCWSHLRRAQVRLLLGEVETARDGFTRARSIAGALVREDPESLAARWSLLAALLHTNDFLQEHGTIPELASTTEDAVTQARFLVSRKPADRTHRIRLLGALSARAKLDRARGRSHESLLTLHAAIPVAKTLARQDGRSIHTVHQLHLAHIDAAWSALNTGQNELARDHARRSFRVIEQFGETEGDPDRAWTWAVRSHGCMAQVATRLDDATLLRTHATAFVKLHDERGEDHLSTDDLLDLANFLAKCLDPRVRDPERAVALARSIVDSGHRTPHALLVLASALRAAGERESAIRHLEEARTACPPGGLRLASIDEALASFD